MTTLFAETHFQSSGAKAIIDDVCEHMRSHGVDVARENEKTILRSEWGCCAISIEGEDAQIKVEAPTLTGIAVLREQMASHLIEHSPQLADLIHWSGAGGELSRPAWFCLLTVVETRRLTPHMQRIRFEGRDLERYDGFDDIHMRLMFPRQDDLAPQWPIAGANGITVYPPDDVLAIRKYTFRKINAATGTVEVDFVLHEDAGPGSKFAATARPGDIIGMGGPGGSSVPTDRDWYLLAGDETALPAIARILETLPDTAHGIALIEVAGAAEEQPIETKTKIDIRWLHRNGAAAGTTDLLANTVRSVRFPSDGSSVFAWTGCEFDAFKSMRSYIRKEQGLSKDDSLIVSYWRLSRGEREVIDHSNDV